MTVIEPRPARPIELADLVRYAGVSRDFNPLHFDPDAARALGSDGVIAHGMYVAGLMSAELLRALGTDHLARFRARFLRPVRVGTCLRVQVATEPGGEVRCHATGEDGAVLVRATALGPSDGSGPPPGAGPAADSAAEGAYGTAGGPSWPVLVEHGPALRFAETIGITNPACRGTAAARAAGHPDMVVAPTYPYAVAAWGVISAAAEPPDHVRTAKSALSGVVAIRHAEQEFVHHRPLFAGERVTVTRGEPHRWTKPGRSGPLAFASVRGRVIAADGTPVVEMTTTLVGRPGGAG